MSKIAFVPEFGYCTLIVLRHVVLKSCPEMASKAYSVPLWTRSSACSRKYKSLVCFVDELEKESANAPNVATIRIKIMALMRLNPLRISKLPFLYIQQ